METSGIQAWAPPPALTTRGLKEEEMKKVAAWFDAAVQTAGDAAKLPKKSAPEVERIHQAPIRLPHVTVDLAH